MSLSSCEGRKRLKVGFNTRAQNGSAVAIVKIIKSVAIRPLFFPSQKRRTNPMKIGINQKDLLLIKGINQSNTGLLSS